MVHRLACEAADTFAAIGQNLFVGFGDDRAATERNTIRHGRAQLAEGEVHDPGRFVLETNGVPLAMGAVFRLSALDTRRLSSEVAGAYDLWISAQLAASGGAFYYVPERLTRYRVHAEMETARRSPDKGDCSVFLHDLIRRGEPVMFEGAQATLLDIDHGTYPFVTSSNASIGGVCTGLGIPPKAIGGVLGVAKAYTTRVGEGPLPTELTGELAERLRESGQEYGASTGRPRRCGWFDAVVVRYAVRMNGITDLAVTKLDVLDTFGRIPVCVGYRIEGELVDDMPAGSQQLEHLEPVYETLEGWCRSTSAARRLADLPPQARAYLDRIQDLLQVPITYVSVGHRRDQIITQTA